MSLECKKRKKTSDDVVGVANDFVPRSVQRERIGDRIGRSALCAGAEGGGILYQRFHFNQCEVDGKETKS